MRLFSPSDFRNRWTTPILPSPNGEQLLEMTSVAMNSTLTRIQYAQRPLELDDA
ncbi:MULTISPECIES: hypothetical protein [Halobacterium]|uniref:hypothetical protein n=1 Tax=Halobacterium TaxID=2239 RepID=UPI000AB80061|nr:MULTISPECIES: hypothetical protein [Halobacterium]MCG1003151.1 hypothetical protein [Halobacterium noricense]